MKTKYIYEFKDTLYFRKIISPKYLIRNKYYTLRLSLRKLLNPYYKILINNKVEFDKLINYMNDNIENFIKNRKGFVRVEDLLDFINNITEEYKINAKIENSELENKRLEAIEFIDNTGHHQGHQLQAISTYYKKILSVYHNLNDTKVMELGSEIAKRSNISKEQILNLPSDKIVTFYEMLIKAEKSILENDLKIYIKRNLYQFKDLYDSNQNENEKVEEALSKYTELIRINSMQSNYLQLIKIKNDVVDLVKREDLREIILNVLQENNRREEIINSSVILNSIKDKFLKFKNLDKKREKAYELSINYFIDFCVGDGTPNNPPIDITNLTSDDISKFEELLANIAPKSKNISQLNLFQMFDYTILHNLPKYRDSTMKGMEWEIKQFLSYIAKYHKQISLDKDLIDYFNPKVKLAQIKGNHNEDDPKIRPFFINELNIILNEIYNDNELTTILRENPQYFYVFIFGLIFGLRIEEALLISIDDIKVQVKNNEKIYYFYLCEDREEQHLKNKNAHRNIPITNFLKELGFLNYINIRYKRGKETLFDYPKSRSGTISQFFSRRFNEYFPNCVDTKENRQLNDLENFIQFRSLRKNFTNTLFQLTRTNYDTEMNKKKILGHDTKTTGGYYGRLEPFIAYQILNSINFEENLEFDNIKNTINKFYSNNIIFELNWLDELSSSEWSKESKVRTRKTRKI